MNSQSPQHEYPNPTHLQGSAQMPPLPSNPNLSFNLPSQAPDTSFGIPPTVYLILYTVIEITFTYLSFPIRSDSLRHELSSAHYGNSTIYSLEQALNKCGKSLSFFLCISKQIALFFLHIGDTQILLNYMLFLIKLW